MELKIMNPHENEIVQEIQWNYEELKAEIAAKMNDYKTLVFTEETIKEAKADRANLRKLKDAFEAERKRIKKICTAPYEKFEKQVKEVTSLIDEPILLIDAQIKEVEEKQKAQKMKEIETVFKGIGFQDFVTLDKIFDSRWMNASVSIKKIEEQMQERMIQIGNDVFAIQQLPEFSFEAMEVYKKSLDITSAIHEGQRLSDIQKRKLAYEEEQRKRREAEEHLRIQKAEEEQVKQEPDVMETPVANPNPTVVQNIEQGADEPLHVIDFRVTATMEKLRLLKEFMKNNQIQYGPVPKKGE